MAKKSTKIEYYYGDKALAFSDVYLKPSYSDINSRFGEQISTHTRLALGAPELKIPFISSGMDTVTEDQMAIVMSLNGGLGEIHRNKTPNEQAELVRKVKERMRLMEKYPPMIPESATIKDALDLLSKRMRGYVIVYRGTKFDGTFSGIASSRDFLSAHPSTRITKVMTPLVPRNGRKLITVNQGTGLENAVKTMLENRIEKIPVVKNKNQLIGVYTLKDYDQIKNHSNASLDADGRLIVGGAIGVHKIDILRANTLAKAGVDVLFIDIAHGHSKYAEEMIKTLKIKEKLKVPIVVGNVATKDGVLFAYEIGADGIKVGIGPGFVCTTRNIAGTGIPQITAVLEAKEALKNKRNAPPVIADGGIREPGDSPKAIACGADSVMIGSAFAGTDASPGDLIKLNGVMQKRVRGMASQGVFRDRMKMGDTTSNAKMYTPEGRETFTPYQGLTRDILFEYIGGLRSAMSYSGSHTIKELQNAKLIHISAHGASEQSRSFS